MAGDDESVFVPRNAKAPFSLGESLDAVSMEELQERILLLRAEIDRIEAEMVRKRASREAAASFFKTGPTS